jgi:hypothetical protein
VLPVFTLTLFLSALLLFMVQPMVGKMILPALGGTPAVWNTCMVFFQAVLLTGYAYAHGAVRVLGVRRQAGLHLLLLLAPFLVLPVAIATQDVPASSDNPEFWLLARLLLGVGLPFFVVSTTAPLLQYWFSHTGHPSAHDPYFLYGASNLGSLLALFGYPLVLERVWGVVDQSRAWSWGYAVLTAAVALCAVLLWTAKRNSPAKPPDAIAEDGDAPATVGASNAHAPVGWGRRLRWIFLAFVPSSLMLGVTTHVTTDLAPVPLLWVLPLALYLLTFVLVFARRPLLPHATIKRITPFVLVPVAIMTVQGEHDLGWFPVAAHLAMFFLAAMLCHGELVASRPGADRLTEFYLWMSFGGVLGGVFNALVAPTIFVTVIEYPLVMVAALLAVRQRAHLSSKLRMGGINLLWIALAGVATWGFLTAMHSERWGAQTPKLLLIAVPAAICLLLKSRPLRLAFGLAAVLAACLWAAPTRKETTLFTGRNFFGVKRVTASGPQGAYHTFHHGRTVHGLQDKRRPHVPLAYFHPTGPMGDVFAHYHRAHTPRRVAIIGLGAGALATYAETRDAFDFFEIDPEVARIAEDPAYFTFLSDCRGDWQNILGDGRIQIEKMPDGAYGLIIIDAFSSDAIPTHLLTREALRLYLAKLNQRGIVVFHISNRYHDLAPLLRALADDAGLVCRMRDDTRISDAETAQGKFPSRYLAMAREDAILDRLSYPGMWDQLGATRVLAPWTDQYSNVLSVVRFRRGETSEIPTGNPNQP